MSPLWLKSLPWSTILSNAPLLVDGAKKLVSLVKSKPQDEVVQKAAGTFAGGTESALGAVHARIERLEEDQRQAAELVRAMAESQAQMAHVLEALRTRARLNLRVAVISLVCVAMLLVWILTH